MLLKATRELHQILVVLCYGMPLGEGKTCLFADRFLFSFKTASVDRCCVLFLLDVPDILRFFPSEKSFELIVICENVQLLDCAYSSIGLKQLDENGFVCNTVFSNLLK